MESSTLDRGRMLLLSADDDWDEEVFDDFDEDDEEVFEDEWEEPDEDGDDDWEDSDDHWSL